MDLAGVILDIYDDPAGLVLRKKTGGKLDEKLASSRLMTHEGLEQLPDRLFALVADNHGEVLRKYAMHDEAHLRTSLMYFSEAAPLFPAEVRAKVASNLVLGCFWYDIEPPEALTKMAFVNALMNGMTIGQGLSDARRVVAEGASRGAQARQVLAHNQMKVAGGLEVQLTDEQATSAQAGEMNESGHIFDKLELFSDPTRTGTKLENQTRARDERRPFDEGPLKKKADLTGTQIMTHQTNREGAPGRTPTRGADVNTKAASWQRTGDLTHVSPPARQKVASVKFAALEGRYPIDTAEQVKQASAYFDEHIYQFSPDQRREFANNLVKRAHTLKQKVAGRALEYSGDNYGPFIEAELHARIASFEGTGREAVYQELLGAVDYLSPQQMASMLKVADDQSGASRVWGRPVVGFRDPFAAVYGADKLAEHQPAKEEVFSWRSGGDYVTGAMLMALASRKADLDTTFGEGFSRDFAKDPIAVFESMPDPQKVVLSRLASDNTSQTFRI